MLHEFVLTVDVELLDAGVPLLLPVGVCSCRVAERRSLERGTPYLRGQIMCATVAGLAPESRCLPGRREKYR